MATFDAYKIMDGQDKSLVAVVWWDGERVRTNDAETLKELHKLQIGSVVFSDGKDFFDVLPRYYSNGYTYIKRAKVDKEGNEV